MLVPTDNDQVEYKNTYTKVKIWCPTCKEYFEILPSSFLYKEAKLGCPKCSIRLMGLNNRTPQDEWIARAQAKWGDVCDYTNTVYTGNKNKVTIYCKEHQGYFEQYPHVHLNGAYGCPICSFKHTASESLGEKRTKEALVELGMTLTPEEIIIGEIEGRNSNVVRIDCSFVYQGKKWWVEYNGEQHYHFIEFFSHGDPDWLVKQVKRDNNVKAYCKEYDILFIEIPFTYIEYEDILRILREVLIDGVNNIVIPEIDYGNRR